MKRTILKVEQLGVCFRMSGGTIYSEGVRDISLEIAGGEILAVVGASGSGKSLLAHAVLGILPYNAIRRGSIMYEGKEVTTKDQIALRGTKIALIPQSVTYLDPLMKVGKQVRGIYGEEKERRRVFERLQLSEFVTELYPFQLSGGMARRVLVSTALVCASELIIADEPTPGMELKDATEALKRLREMADEGKAVMLITHDIDLAVEVADRIAVMYDGRLIDTVSATVFKGDGSDIRNPYTKALYHSLPQNGFRLYAAADVQAYASKKEASPC